jgi:Terminase RNaseH-like domain
MVLTDPPYNVPINGHVTKRVGKFDEFEMASGEMTDDQFREFLRKAYLQIARATVPGVEAATLLMEKGRVWMPTSAPWLETLIKELQAFPLSKHDDQVDSISQMLWYWRPVLQRTRTLCNPRARREVPANYDPVTMRINAYTIPGDMPDLWQ